MTTAKRFLVPLFAAMAVSALGAFSFLYFRSTQDLRVKEVETSRFGTVRIILPPDDPQGFSLYFSSQRDGDSHIPEAARSLAKLGLGVAVIDGTEYLKTVNRTPLDACTLFSGELSRLSQVLQKTAGVPRLFIPLLAGDGDGAAIAVTALAQSPKDFKGAFGINFCPRLQLQRPLCEEDGLTSNGPAPYTLTAPNNLSAPVLIWNEPNTDCSRAAWEGFAGHLKRLSIKEKAFTASELVRFVQGFGFFEHSSIAGSIAELPVIDLFPDTDQHNDLVIFFSGDGGWATIDKELGEALRRNGVTVIGFDTLRYFWKHRTGQQTALDLERIITHYSSAQTYQRLTLIGFSFGADVLPPVVDLLDEATRKALHRIILLNPTFRTDFEVNFSDWLSLEESDQGIELLPEIEKIDPSKLVCIYTTDEAEESVCTRLPKGRPGVLEFEGNHHFDGDYARLARNILAILRNDALPRTLRP